MDQAFWISEAQGRLHRESHESRHTGDLAGAKSSKGKWLMTTHNRTSTEEFLEVEPAHSLSFLDFEQID